MTLYAIERATALARVGRTAEAQAQLTNTTLADQLPMNLVSLAALEASTGDCSTALAHADLAVQRGPSEASVALNAGAIAERCANGNGAVVNWYGAGLAAMPQLAGDPWWNDPARSSLRPAILERASGILLAAGDRAGTVVLAAWSGDLAGARRLLPRSRLPASPARPSSIGNPAITRHRSPASGPTSPRIRWIGSRRPLSRGSRGSTATSRTPRSTSAGRRSSRETRRRAPSRPRTASRSTRPAASSFPRTTPGPSTSATARRTSRRRGCSLRSSPAEHPPGQRA